MTIYQGDSSYTFYNTRALKHIEFKIEFCLPFIYSIQFMLCQVIVPWFLLVGSQISFNISQTHLSKSVRASSLKFMIFLNIYYQTISGP